MIGQSKQHLAAAGEGNGEHFGFTATIGLITARCPRRCFALRVRFFRLFGDRCLFEQVVQQSPRAIGFAERIASAAAADGGANFVIGGASGARSIAIAHNFLVLGFEIVPTVRPERLSRRSSVGRETRPHLVIGDDPPPIVRFARQARAAHHARRQPAVVRKMRQPRIATMTEQFAKDPRQRTSLPALDGSARGATPDLTKNHSSRNVNYSPETTTDQAAARACSASPIIHSTARRAWWTVVS